MKEGEFVKVDYVGRISGTNQVFDSTSEEVARKEGAYNEKYRYGPVLVIIGSGMIVPGVDEELKKMKPGEERSVDVSPEKGFGKRDVRNIRIVSRANFIRQKINPVPGEFVEINGRQAKIQSVSGGRVRVDYNHPLAGKDLRYRIKIVQVIEKPLEKIRAIMDYYRMDCDISLEGETLEVKTKEKAPDFVQKLLTDVITKWINEVKRVDFSSEEKGQKKKEQEPSGEKKAEEKPGDKDQNRHQDI